MKKFLFLIFIFNALPVHSQQHAADSLQRLYQKAKNDRLKAKILNDIANVYVTSNPDKAILYANKALTLSKKINHYSGIGAAYNWLGQAYRIQGDHKKALEYYEKSVLAYHSANEKISVAAALNNTGNVYIDQGNYDKGYEKYLASLAICEEMNDTPRMASALANIGVMFQNKGSSSHSIHDYEEALKYHKRSYDLDQSLKDKLGISIDLNNLGSTYSDMGKLDPNPDIFKKALSYFEQSLKLKEEVEDIYGKAIALVNIGDAYIELGKLSRKSEMFAAAVFYGKKSLVIFQQIGDPYGTAYAYNKVGYAFAEKQLTTPGPGLPDSALYYLQAGLPYAVELNAKDILKELYSNLSYVHEIKKNYKESLRFERLHAEIKDSLLNDENARSLNEMETKYETAEKDKALLVKDAEIGKQQLEAKQKATERNAFIAGFGLVLILSFFIFRSYRQKKKANEIIIQQKEEVELQRDIIEEKNKDITDSINYARRIQRTMITSESFFKKQFCDFFVLYKPKDIVSGDFYWGSLTSTGNVLIATADCTGHGVPGAFMSMVGISKLNEIVVQRSVSKPAEILNQLRQEVIRALNPEDAVEESKDGMDISLCAFNLNTGQLQYANANNSIYIISNGVLHEKKADKMPVGKYGDEDKPFTHNELVLQKNDVVYTFTDGYADQFGGDRGKKFKYRQLEELLVSIYNKPMDEQKIILDTTMSRWRGNLEQVDDILIIGVRI